MGFISRKVFPAAGKMFVCCPAMRSRSRHPVKRYKKLLADIFPKSSLQEGPPNERRIVKLCEYAAKNPLRIPKIAKHLEEKIFRGLQNEHLKIIKIVMAAYDKLLFMCKEYTPLYSASLFRVIDELLDNTKQDSLQIIGSETLIRFIYSQGDGTHAHNIENLVPKVIKMALDDGDNHSKCCLRASGLQCISAMVWFMGERLHIFAHFNEIVHVILDNFKDAERSEPRHNWLDEVVRTGDVSPSFMTVMPRLEKKDPLLLSREEIETPKVWAQICIHKMGELAKESATLRKVLDPLFNYFDVGNHWIPRQGLAMIILSEMTYLVECSGNEQVILGAIIRHLDHKNVAHDPQVKSSIIQIASVLTRQIRSRVPAADIRIVNDLSRHLRKSIQETIESSEQHEPNWNPCFQNAIEDCLLEIVKGIGDGGPIFDMMAIILESLPSLGVIARAAVESMLILAHIISIASITTHFEQVFPEVLLAQLLKIMMHSDNELRIGAHQIFGVLLAPSSTYSRNEFKLRRSGYLFEPKMMQSKTANPFTSATALFDKLRKEKESEQLETLSNETHGYNKDKEFEVDFKHGMLGCKSPSFYKRTSLLEKRVPSTISPDIDSNILKLNEDQIVQLLSAFWIQANFSDNVPSNFEALAHSFSLTLISSRLQGCNQKIVRFFQLPLSLRCVALNLSIEELPPSCHISLFILATSMLMFTAKIYQLPDLHDFLKSVDSYHVDPYLSINNDMQVCVKPQVGVKEYGSATDNQSALSLLTELSDSLHNSDKAIINIIARSLSNVVELDTFDLAHLLAEMFSPDDTFLFAAKSVFCTDHCHKASLSQESLSSDMEDQAMLSIEDDTVSVSTADLFRSMLKVQATPSSSHIISASQLLESALEAAGRIAGTSTLTSTLTYSTTANQCEALSTGTRKKLSSWLAQEDGNSKSVENADVQLIINKITRRVGGLLTDKRSGFSLPPASPFDNFLKAARQ